MIGRRGILVVMLGAVVLGAAGPDRAPGDGVTRPPAPPAAASGTSVPSRNVDPRMTVVKPPIVGRTPVIRPPDAGQVGPGGTIIVPK